MFRHYPGQFLPLPIFVIVKHIYLNILAIGFFLLLPALVISNYSSIIRIVLLILVTPFFCFFSYAAIDHPEEILASAKLGNHRYHVTIEGIVGDVQTAYNTYRCNGNDLGCEIIYSETSGGIDDIVLVTDENTKELHVLRNGYIKYTDGEHPRMILASLQYEGFLYAVTTPPVDVYAVYGSLHDKYIYSLYRCTISFIDCQKLPFHYIDSGGSFTFDVNENTNELELHHWRSDTNVILIYSYGKEPKCHVEQCSTPDN